MPVSAEQRAILVQAMSDERLLIRWQELIVERAKFIDLALRGPVRLRKSYYGNAIARDKAWTVLDTEIKRRKNLFT